MKTTKPAVILPALVLLLTAAAVQSAENPAKKEISNTRTASCLFKITTSEAVLPLNEFAVDYLLRSSGVAGKAAREVLEISPDIASELIEIEEVFTVDSALDGFGGSGYGGGGYGGGMMGGGYGGGMMGGGYGGGMDLPADSTPGASGYGSTTTSRSTRRTSPTTARTPARPPGSTSRSARTTTPRPTRTPTTTASTRIPAFPGGAVSGFDDYYRKPKPTYGQSTRTTTKSTSSAAEQTILFYLQVKFSDDESIKSAAEEFMNALIENLRSALSGAFDQYNDKLNNQLQLANEEAQRAETALVQMQKELRNISGSRNLSRNVILQNISNLRRQLQDIIMHQASQEIYIQATTDQIVETQSKVAKQLQKDPITIELKGIADIHTKNLENIQKLVKAGTTSSDKVEEFLEELARARIELAKRREQISNSAGGNKLDRLNTELAEYSVNMAQNKFSISNLENQIAEAEAFLAKADDYELLSLKADIAKQNLEETLLWRARLGRNIRLIQPPDVTVIGAE